MKWPTKEERENWEIENFISHYHSIVGGEKLKIYSRGERPDFVLLSESNNQKYGVELTSVYMNNRSVPDHHIPDIESYKHNPYGGEDNIEKYKCKVLKSIRNKNKLALTGYSTENPLILSVYINELLSMLIGSEEWSCFFLDNGFDIDETIFSSIILWPIAEDREFGLFKNYL
ncbi:hypothetical protein [Teredinibacter sp. KSP-S5-2]|uniref:hypothetical protein n=1 Tax=Teredinibacter sp. KSP-S5-2 TaxID=3034506 RepID=UPI002934A25C|nr:hypothetical protein [Teredinibacter sp. KSP-S5-2]WNO10502.1 hypothetical protein P5V12_04885 [Teredinibacter sp. KSP-S5-2]